MTAAAAADAGTGVPGSSGLLRRSAPRLQLEGSCWSLHIRCDVCAAPAAEPGGLVENLRQATFPPLGQKYLQHVIHGDDTHQLFVLIHDGQRHRL